MCVIVVQPAGKQLSGNKFRNCWNRNSDGGGYSFIQDEDLVIKKGYFDQVTMLDEYREDIKANPESPFLIHFRISTSGLVDEINTHPHRVRDDLVMAHNGHITGYGSKEQSDTLEFVSTILKQMPPAWEEDEVQVHLIEQYIRGDKMALLRSDGEYVIINEDAGNWQDGLWFSNKSWEKKKKYVVKGNHRPFSGTKTSTVTGATGGNGKAPNPIDYTACGWDNPSTPYSGEYETYFGENCAYCDGTLEEFDAEFCVRLDAWYPICADCVVDQEQDLVISGAVCDAVDEVWDELVYEYEDDKALDDTPPEEKEEKPATGPRFRLSSYVFRS